MYARRLGIAPAACVALLIGLAPPDGALARDRATAGSELRSSHGVLRHRAKARTAVAPPARASPRGAMRMPASPGPGYCWYFIDRGSGAPGFWDLCRGR